MVTTFQRLSCATAALLGALSLAQAQTNPAPAANAKSPTVEPPALSSDAGKASDLMLVQASAPGASPAAAPANAATTATEPDGALDSGGVGIREFQGDEVGQVLRLLARQSKVNMVVSEAVIGTVTMRLEDVTALQAIAIIVKAKGLFMDKIENVYYIKTGAERTAEPTESDSYQFSYSRAKDVAPLVASQLASKDPPQIDERTNMIFIAKRAATSITFANCLCRSTSRPSR